MMNVTSVKRIHQSDWTDSGVRFLRARDIVAAAKNEELADCLYISKEKYEEYSALSGKVGVSDLLVTGVGTIGVPYLVRNLEPLYFKDGNIIWFQNSDKIDGKFLFYSFSAEQIQGFINESAGIGTVGTYTIESGKKTPISLPNQIEQAKVGEFFQQLDNLITLHQRKCKIRNLRCPKSTAITWEQRKFDEAFIERRDKTEKENEDILLSCAINGMFLNSELFGHFRGTTTIGYLRVKKNDLILSAQNLHLGNANVNLRFEHGIISPAYKVYDLNNCNPEFVQSWVKRDDTKNFFLAATTEGASQCRKNIEWETLGKQTISMPSLDEQKWVGSFFKQLDNLITLHQRKQKQKSPPITASLVIYGSICFDCFMSVSNTS